LIEIPEKLFQARAAELKAAAARGDVAFLCALPGIDIVSAPRITNRVGQDATIEVTRLMHYPTDFDLGADGKRIPKAFAQKNLGIVLQFKPLREKGGFVLSGKMEITDFQGFVEQGKDVRMPAFLTREMTLFQPLADGQSAGLWLGRRSDVSATAETEKETLVMLTAKRVTPAPPSTP
jgi:hypothetical protein